MSSPLPTTPTTWPSSTQCGSYYQGMVRPGQISAQEPYLPPRTVGVSAWEMGRAQPASVWERELCDAIEKVGYSAQPVPPAGRGAAAGGPLWMELRRILAGKVPLVRKIVALERWARKAWLSRAYRKAESRLPPTNLLDVQITAGPIDRNSSAQWVTTRDLVGLLGRLREVLDQRGNYQISLSGETRAGGQLIVFDLSEKDLRRSRVIRRLTQLADEAQSETVQLAVRGEDLRMWTWRRHKR